MPAAHQPAWTDGAPAPSAWEVQARRRGSGARSSQETYVDAPQKIGRIASSGFEVRRRRESTSGSRCGSTRRTATTVRSKVHAHRHGPPDTRVASGQFAAQNGRPERHQLRVSSLTGLVDGRQCATRPSPRSRCPRGSRPFPFPFSFGPRIFLVDETRFLHLRGFLSLSSGPRFTSAWPCAWRRPGIRRAGSPWACAMSPPAAAIAAYAPPLKRDPRGSSGST